MFSCKVRKKLKLTNSSEAGTRRLEKSTAETGSSAYLNDAHDASTINGALDISLE